MNSPTVFNNFGIAKRLYLVSFVLIAALAILAVTAWSKLNEVAHLADQTGETRVPQIGRASCRERVLLMV